MGRQVIKIFAMVGLFFCGLGLQAQHRSELSGYGGGGVSTLQYKVVTGKQNDGLGGHLGLGYHYFFRPKWGLGTGVELGGYHAKYNVDKMGVSQMTADVEGNAFEFRSTVAGFKESQRVTLMQIPLMLQFQTGGNRHRFYVAGGGKAGFPLKGKYNNTASYRNSGYFVHENSLYDTQEFLGFGYFAGKKADGELDFKTAFFLAAETGMKWKLNDKLSLYTGAYFDYGLSKQNMASRSHLVEYNKSNPPAFKVNSVLTFDPPYSPLSSSTIQRFTDNKVTPFSAGIKLRLSFALRD